MTERKRKEVVVDYEDEIKFSYVHKETHSVMDFPVPKDLENWYKVPRIRKNIKGKKFCTDKLEFVSSEESMKPITHAKRKRNYEDNTDGLFMRWQFLNATDDPRAEEAKSEWIEAVKKVKEEFPHLAL